MNSNKHSKTSHNGTNQPGDLPMRCCAHSCWPVGGAARLQSLCEKPTSCMFPQKGFFKSVVCSRSLFDTFNVFIFIIYFQCPSQCPSTGQRYCIDPRHYERSSWGDHRRCGVHRCKGLDCQSLPVSMPVEMTSVCQDPIDCRVSGGPDWNSCRIDTQSPLTTWF